MFGGVFGSVFPAGRFEASYRCYPVSFIDKINAENGDKVFLPPSALDRLSHLHIDYPMLFKVEARSSGKSTHCGVLEFIADEGVIYMPYWMMQNLVIEEGSIVKLTSATLPKGTFVKLQPHSTDFLDISNPRAVLETTLRNFTCLTVGDTVPIHYNNKKYYIDIVEAQPSDAISVVETDCNVDFAPPLDYVEPERPGAAQQGGTVAPSGPKKAGKLMYRDRLAAKFAAEKKGGAGSAVSAPPPEASSSGTSARDQDKRNSENATGFVVFQGKGRSLRD